MPSKLDFARSVKPDGFKRYQASWGLENANKYWALKDAKQVGLECAN